MFFQKLKRQYFAWCLFACGIGISHIIENVREFDPLGLLVNAFMGLDGFPKYENKGERMYFRFLAVIGLPFIFIGCLGTKSISGSKETLPQPQHTDTSHTHEDIDAEMKHLIAFQSLLQTDPEAARNELSKATEIKFGHHRLRKEWEDLFFRMAQDKKGTILDLKHFNELQLQMLKDMDPKTPNQIAEMQSLQKALKQQILIIEALKKQGDTPETFETEFNFSIE